MVVDPDLLVELHLIRLRLEQYSSALFLKPPINLGIYKVKFAKTVQPPLLGKAREVGLAEVQKV